MEDKTKIAICMVICFTLCVIFMACTLMLTNGSYEFNISMDNNTRLALESIDYNSINECPYCPCKVYEYNESGDLNFINFSK